MAQQTLTTRIVLRNDVQANWTENNPKLLKGEIGLESDTKRYKIGNGVDTWDLLPYFANIDSEDAMSLKILIDMLDKDDFGSVNEVLVNDESVVQDKVAHITIGTLTFTPDQQSMDSNGENFTQNITLHKVAKTGSYKDLVDKLNVVDNLDSVSTEDALSANQGNVLKQMLQSLPTAKAYPDLQALVTALNGYSETEMTVGTNLYIQALNVPDLWVYGVENEAVEYEYTDDDAFVSAIRENGFVQIGYYQVSVLETAKVNLSDYYTKSQIDELIQNVNNTISALENRVTEVSDRVTAIEEDQTILRSTDSFILDGGNSEV